MHLSSAILGTDVVAKLEKRLTAPLLVIGKDAFSRTQLSKIGCFNFTAAARLSHLLSVELAVKDTADLFHNYGPAHLALPGLGAICLATVGAAFEVKKLGTLADYVQRHQEKGQKLVTFHTLKQNVLDKEADRKEKQDAKRRRRARLNRAATIRGDRHLQRHDPQGWKVAHA